MTTLTSPITESTVPTSQATHFECRECGRLIPCEAAWHTTIGDVCERCYDDYFIPCVVCGIGVYFADTFLLRYKEYVCAKCYIAEVAEQD